MVCSYTGNPASSEMPVSRGPVLFMALMLLALSLPLMAGTRDPGEYFFQQSFGDLTEELEIAKEEDLKGIFIMFEEDDCPWCAKMKARVLNQPVVQDYYRGHFRLLSMNINGDEPIVGFDGKEMTQKRFSDSLRVRATPVMIFFDLDGRPMTRYTGAVRNVQEFLWLGEFVVDDHYKNTKFTVYKRRKKKESVAGQPGER